MRLLIFRFSKVLGSDHTGLGSGEKFDWKILDKYELEHPFFLSGGISAWDVRGITKINHNSRAGVDLNSRFEIRPGIKNISLLKQFIEELRER